MHLTPATTLPTCLFPALHISLSIPSACCHQDVLSSHIEFHQLVTPQVLAHTPCCSSQPTLYPASAVPWWPPEAALPLVPFWVLLVENQAAATTVSIAPCQLLKTQVKQVRHLWSFYIMLEGN